MTYNIHRWAGQDRRLDLDRLASVIRASGADVVMLNEVLHPVLMDERTVVPLMSLADRLGMACAFGPSGWTDFGPGWRGPQGNALLSRYPLSDVTNVQLPRLPGSRPRALLGARLAGGPLAGVGAYVTHLDHAFEVTRMLQVRGVLRQTEDYAPHFVAGDFNTPGFRGAYARRLTPPVLRAMQRAGYDDAFHVAGRGHGRTFPARLPVLRIDFCFVPNRWSQGVRSAYAFGEGATHCASDHRPVLVEWMWPDRISEKQRKLQEGGRAGPPDAFRPTSRSVDS